MKTRDIIRGILACLPLLISIGASAYVGSEGGNGGDMCEDRIKTIRDDISSWISRGGAQGLTLPAGVSLSQYQSRMQFAISTATISCTNSGIKVFGADKVCKNYSTPGGQKQIVCNASGFARTAESDQYVLVHHEFAGLSGFEVNQGPSSNYVISNQISEYLVDQTVKRLAVKRPFTQAITAGPRYAPMTPLDAAYVVKVLRSSVRSKQGCGGAVTGQLRSMVANFRAGSLKQTMLVLSESQSDPVSIFVPLDGKTQFSTFERTLSSGKTVEILSARFCTYPDCYDYDRVLELANDGAGTLVGARFRDADDSLVDESQAFDCGEVY